MGGCRSGLKNRILIKYPFPKLAYVPLFGNGPCLLYTRSMPALCLVVYFVLPQINEK
jgi:hypothetical protein